MTAEVHGARLTAALWECDRHSDALAETLADWHRAPAPNLAAVEHDSGMRWLTDQLLFRFAKLQDAMGERLVPATLAWLREAHEEWPMRDRLDRLQRLGYLDVEVWQQWRDVRNRLVYEYPDQPTLRFAALLATVNAAQAVVQALGRWKLKMPA